MPFPLLAAATMLGTSAAGPSVLAGAGAAGAGAAAGGGLFAGMTGLGMGLSAIQAFGGSGSGGYAPTYAIPLSPEGEKLEKTLYEKTKKQYETGLMPRNLASIFIGKIKRREGKTRRQARGFLTSMAGGVRGGGDVRALMGEGGRRMFAETGPARWRKGQRTEEYRNALKMMENLRNVEKQTPLLRAQAQMYKSLQSQGQRAAQGQALGSAAQMGTLMAMAK